MTNSPHYSLLLLLLLLICASCSVQALAPFSRRTFLQTSAAASAVVATTTAAPRLATAATAASSNTLPATNSLAPDFDLPNSKGTGSTSLQTLLRSNKWTVLYFYPGAFTKGCTMEARAFQRDLQEYQKLNAQIVGVSVDAQDKNAEFCSAEGLDFYLLSDVGGSVSRKYGSANQIAGFGTFSNRQTYLIDPAGKVRYVFLDVESRIPSHSKEVLEKLQELVA